MLSKQMVLPVSCFTKGLTTKVLTALSFLIPGLGQSGEECMSQIVNAFSSVGNAVQVVRLKCKRIQCPNCFEWWISQITFKYAVMIESYAKVTGERPAALQASVHPDSVRLWSWLNYCNFFRKSYDRLEKLGILGGIRIFHPFRIKHYIKGKLRDVGYGRGGSGGFWAAIRSNALNLKNWRAYVDVAPHIHVIGFPSWIKPNTCKDIVIKKYAVLDGVCDVVAHLKYTLSHCGLLVDSEIEPSTPFGCLHGFKPEKFLNDVEMLTIKKQVAEAMGLEYNELSDSVEVIGDDDDEPKYEWLPLHEFADYSAEQQDFTDAWVNSISNHDHKRFVWDIIALYNERRVNLELERHKRHVFMEDLVDVPDGFEIVEVEFRDKL